MQAAITLHMGWRPIHGTCLRRTHSPFFSAAGSSGGATRLFAARDLVLHTVNLLLLRAAWADPRFRGTPLPQRGCPEFGRTRSYNSEWVVFQNFYWAEL